MSHESAQLTNPGELSYPEQRINIDGFLRLDGEKTIIYFPEPPTPEANNAFIAQLTDADIQTVRTALGRKENLTYISPDAAVNMVRKGLEYDLFDPVREITVRFRDIIDGQIEEGLQRPGGETPNFLRGRENGSDNPRSDQTPREESL